MSSQLYAAKSDGIDACAAARPSNHIYTAALYQSTVHRPVKAAGWLIRLPVLHDTSRLVSKQTVGLRDVRTLNKNSSGDEIANVNFYAVRPEATRIR